MIESKFTGYGRKNNIDFGDHIKYPNGYSKELHIYKVIGALKSNTWREPPDVYSSKDIIHDEMAIVLNVIHCGVVESQVIRVKESDCLLYAPAEITAMQEENERLKRENEQLKEEAFRYKSSWELESDWHKCWIKISEKLQSDNATLTKALEMAVKDTIRGGTPYDDEFLSRCVNGYILKVKYDQARSANSKEEEAQNEIR